MMISAEWTLKSEAWSRARSEIELRYAVGSVIRHNVQHGSTDERQSDEIRIHATNITPQQSGPAESPRIRTDKRDKRK